MNSPARISALPAAPVPASMERPKLSDVCCLVANRGKADMAWKAHFGSD